MPTTPNLVIPQIGTGGIPVSPYSIGTTAVDADGNVTSAIDTINGPSNLVQQANATSVPPFIAPLGSASQILVSDLITNYYRNYASGTNLLGGGISSNYGLATLADSQVLAFTLIGSPETPSAYYHTNQDGSVAIQFWGDTIQRDAANWKLAVPKVVNVSITTAGYGTVIINSAAVASLPTTIATGLRAPYSVLVTVTDLTTRLTMQALAEQPNYGAGVVAFNTYRVPYRASNDSAPGVWYNDGGYTYRT